MALGDILREFQAPIEARGFGRAVAFDGQFLYLTRVGDRNIHRVTTTGTFVSSIPTRIDYGALKFDSTEGVFWAGGFEGTSDIDKISISGDEAAVLDTINYSDTVPLDPDDRFPGFVSGITVDPATDTLFFSTNLGGSVYNIRKDGSFISSFQTPPQDGFSSRVTGVESDGINLWLNLVINLGNEFNDVRVYTVQTDTAGNETSNRFLSGTGFEVTEDLEFDNITFAPRCALWSNEGSFGGTGIRAFVIPCPGRYSFLRDLSRR
ncbi:hypothetical protein ABES80_05115 [Bacillus gobiensis]|uniref:hypothetical protein n=1 Tax=Bacillus gobiensis TaxID=1441095 RepID=UPI003D23B2B8